MKLTNLFKIDNGNEIELDNNHLLLAAIERDAEKDAIGLHIPKENIDDEQVAQGIVVYSSSRNYKKGDKVMFHKTLPIDIKMKLLGDDEIKEYFFIKIKDLICKFK